MNDEINTLIEYIAFILRQSFLDSKANIEIEDQSKWILLLNKHDWDHVILPATICGYTVMVSNISGVEFDIAVCQEDTEDKNVKRFFRAFYDNQQVFSLFGFKEKLN